MGDREKVPYKIIGETVSCNPASLVTLNGPEYIPPPPTGGSGRGGGNSGGGTPLGGGGSGGRPIGGGGSGGRPIGGGGMSPIGGGGGGMSPIGGGGSDPRGGGGSGRGGGGSGGGTAPSSNDDSNEADIQFLPVNVNTMNTLAPLPEHTEPTLHPVGTTCTERSLLLK